MLILSHYCSGVSIDHVIAVLQCSSASPSVSLTFDSVYHVLHDDVLETFGLLTSRVAS